MHKLLRLTAVGAVGVNVASCALVPGMPPDFALPVQKIVEHAFCELRLALHDISTDHPSFLKRNWAIAVTLTPKIDTEASLRAGLTGKSTSVANAPFFNTWSVGNAPGAEYDLKGHTDGSAAYSVTSTALMDKKHPLDCDTTSTAYNALTRYLGIRDWLERTAATADGQLSGLTKLDKPTYNSEITITIDGSGTFTYNQPFGTNFLGALGSYKLDESVAIAFTPNTAPTSTKKIQTLPTGAEYSSVSSGSVGVVSPAAQSRLDTLSLQQSITNLQTAIQQRR